MADHKIKCSCYHGLLVYQLILLVSAIFTSCQPPQSSKSAQSLQNPVILDHPGYPLVFELNQGESYRITRKWAGKIIERNILIHSVKMHFEPNIWFQDSLHQQTYLQAEIAVSVSGKDTVLLHRPYQMPVHINGLRIYVEAVKEWAENAQLADLKDLQKQVRLAVCASDETWGPATFRFPIADYRWRSAVYNNTWGSLVPYNLLYYHRGEDYGAIPDKLEVLSPFNGTVTQTPLPDGDGKSNAIFIRQDNGITTRISHMNTESLNPNLPVGSMVKAGAKLAKTGMTWDGRKSQVNDPHCHIELLYDSTKLASFPYLIEAYFRDYPDAVLAIAGGYQYALPGQSITLDASRSLARPGTQIVSYQWKLHNGTVSYTPVTQVSYQQPGLYTEELTVTTADGQQDKDFLQVRVFDADRGKNLAYGWAYHYPVRKILAGTPVLFWNRLVNTTAPVMVDFGDGSKAEEIKKEAYHSFSKKGIYTVSLSSTGPSQEPVVIKMDVHVE